LKNKISENDRFGIGFKQLDGTWLPSPTEPENLKRVTTNYFDMNAGILYNGSLDGSNAVFQDAPLSVRAVPSPRF
jgi:hypothetical protein